MPQPIPNVPPGRAYEARFETRSATSRANPHAPSFRKLLYSLPVLLVALGFVSIVWLAYVEEQPSARGEPPLVKALPDPIRIAPEAGEVARDKPDQDEPSALARLDEGTEPEVLIQPESSPQPALPSRGRDLALSPPEPGTPRAQTSEDELETGTLLEEDEAIPGLEVADPAELGVGGPAEPDQASPPAASEAPADTGSGISATDEDATDEEAAPVDQEIASLEQGSGIVPLPAPERPALPPTSSQAVRPPATAVQPDSRRQPFPATPPAGTGASGSAGISPSGVETGRTESARLRLETPASESAPRPAASPVTPEIVPGPGDDGRSASEPVYRIQLASVREEPDARRAWDLYRLDLGDVLTGLTPVIERAEVANGTFFRVQAGAFIDRLDAEAVCDQLRLRNTDCLVVRR